MAIVFNKLFVTSLMQQRCVHFFIAFVLTLFSIQAAQADNGRQLFNQLQDRIYQVRLLEHNSENKSVIGSGFQVSADGLIATNYHVVANAVQTPEKYRLEYVDHQGNHGSLSLVDVDVIHDLALVRRTQAPTVALPLNTVAPDKGDVIYAIGNPRDLGMTIVNGTYSGLMQNTYYGHLVFSGSLNPGMSGGPTLNEKGEVIGVNVATSGEQLSFLVPAIYLQRLMANQHPTDNQWKSYIQTQLVASQKDRIEKLLAGNWHAHDMGPAQVPGEITDFISCWSDSNQEETDKRYDSTTTLCKMKERLSVSETFTTGSLGYNFTLLQNKDLNRFQFYSLVTSKYEDAPDFYNRSKDNVENFRCNTDFIKQNGGDFKNTICARRFKDYPQLYDVLLISTSITSNDQALISMLMLTGVTRDSGLQFAQRFMEGVSWTSSSK